MDKKYTKYTLGTYAEGILLMVLPLMIIQLVTLAAYIAPLEGGELLKHEETIRMLFDGIGRGFAFIAIATLLVGYWEKKQNGEA